MTPAAVRRAGATAAELLGAADALTTNRTLIDQQRHETATERCRAVLDDETIDAARRRGAFLDWPSAAALALTTLADPTA